ncbi:hypothetical protein BGW80DRAFT_602883 [Lactifluus volemus]|nr:hypothetical protein BGW80DRAFT_602883 [Lactifluus volemus]
MRPARICHEHEIFKGRSMHTGTMMSSATRLKNIGRKRLGRILRTTFGWGMRMSLVWHAQTFLKVPF